jgi:hypothetical protein
VLKVTTRVEQYDAMSTDATIVFEVRFLENRDYTGPPQSYRNGWQTLLQGVAGNKKP